MTRLYLSIDMDDACLDILHATLAPAYRSLDFPSLPGILPGFDGLADPGMDAILYWSDAGNDFGFATIGTGLTFAGGVLAAVGTAPGGASGNVQFNNGSGGFGGESGFNWTTASKKLVVTDGTRTATLNDGTYAGKFQLSSTLSRLSNGTQAAFLQFGTSTFATLCTSTVAGRFGDGSSHSVDLSNGTYAVDAQLGSVNVLGTSGNTFRWNAAASAPTPTAATTPTGNTFGPSATPDLLGTPDAWILVNIAGTNYKVPAYL